MFGPELRGLPQYADEVASRVQAAEFAANAASTGRRDTDCASLEKDGVSIVQRAFTIRSDGFKNARDERGGFGDYHHVECEDRRWNKATAADTSPTELGLRGYLVAKSTAGA